MAQKSLSMLRPFPHAHEHASARSAPAAPRPARFAGFHRTRSPPLPPAFSLSAPAAPWPTRFAGFRRTHSPPLRYLRSFGTGRASANPLRRVPPNAQPSLAASLHSFGTGRALAAAARVFMVRSEASPSLALSPPVRRKRGFGAGLEAVRPAALPSMGCDWRGGHRNFADKAFDGRAAMRGFCNGTRKGRLLFAFPSRRRQFPEISVQAVCCGYRRLAVFAYTQAASGSFRTPPNSA